MEASQMQRFRERLVKEQTRLQQNMQHGEDSRVEILAARGNVSNLPTHSADRDVEGLDAQVRIEQTLRNELDAIAGALQRLQQGTYGQCQQCGKEIAIERLDAIPYTPYCIDCERAAEVAEGPSPKPS